MLWVDQLGQDLRYALALLTRDRAFTFVAALALALGIAATTSLITVVNAVILRGLPLADPDRLVAITMRDPRNRQLAMSSPDFDDWQRASRSFSGMTIMLPVAFSVSDHDHLPEQFFGPYTSTNLFTTIGQRPLLGRDFTPDTIGLGRRLSSFSDTASGRRATAAIRRFSGERFASTASSRRSSA